MEAKPFVRDTLFYLNIAGMNPENQTLFAKTRAVLTIVLGIFVTTFILLDILLNWKGFDSLLEGSDVFVAVGQGVIKSVFMVVYSGRLNKLMENIQQFWSIEKTGEEVKIEISSIYSLIGKLRRGMKISYISTNIIFMVKPLITRTKVLPLKFYQPFDLLVSPRYEIVYFLQYFNGILSLSVLLAFDLFFILFITHAVCELKMLKYEFVNLKINLNVEGDESVTLKEISGLVEHHVFILRFIKDLKDTFSVLMITEFVASMFCFCLGLFSLSGEGFPPSPTVAAKYSLFILSYTGQLYIFCFGGNVLAQESSTVANAIYHSGWWLKTQPHLRKAIIMVMLRTQNVEKLTVGGMLDLDLKCFTTVIKTAFSFFTLMQTMHNKSQRKLT